MLRVLRMFAVLIAPTLLFPALQAEVMRYEGTIGQRRAEMTIEVEGETLSAVHYRVDQQKETDAAEMRLIGTTIVMADDDGNLFHLHLQDGEGHTATDFKHADALAGTMLRGEDVDLPVKLKRVAGK